MFTMLNPGDIVTQDYTVLNNCKDNKELRLSVVLFDEILEDGERFVCTCPITNTQEKHYSQIESCHIVPGLIISIVKNSCIRISSANLYKERTIHPTGLRVPSDHMGKIYEKLMNYANTKSQEDLYKMIRDHIPKKQEEEVKVKSDQKQKKKSRQERRERIRKAKRGGNID